MRPSTQLALDRNNKLFTTAVIGGGGVIGSGISFLVGGAVIVNVYHWVRGRFSITRNRDVLYISALFALFYFVHGLSSIIHYSRPMSLWPLVQNALFLAFPLIYSRLKITRREPLVVAAEAAFVLGAIGGFAFAAVEVFALGLPRAEGLAGNQNPFALVNTFLYGGCLAVALRRGGAIGMTSLVAAILAAGSVLLSGTRTLWPMLLVTPILLSFVYPTQMKELFTSRRAAITGVLAAIVVLVALPFAQGRIHDLRSDFDQVFGEGELNNSLGLRLEAWEIGYGLVVQNPLLGHGPEETAHLLKFTHFHNFVLDAWVASGILGVAAVLAVLVGPVLILRRRSVDGVGIFGVTIALLLSTSYAVSGTLGIMFGHDILDALYVYGMVLAAYLACGGGPSPASGTLTE